MDQLVATCTPHLRRTAGGTPPLFCTGSHILPSLHITSNPPSHTRTLQVSGRTPLELWCISQGWCDTRRIRTTQGMPKRKTFNRPALSCTSTRTHSEGRRSVELRYLLFSLVRAGRGQGFRWPYGGSQLVLTLYRMYIFVFKYVTV